MRHISKLASILLLLAITPFAGGEEPLTQKTPTRLTYQNSLDLPNGIAFDALLSHLNHINTQYGPAEAAEWVEYNLGLNNIQAHAFVSQALTTRYLIDTDAHEQTKRLACEYVGPDVDRADQYAALQQMSEINRAISDHYYEQTLVDLDSETAMRLQKVLDERKLKMGYHETDYERYDQMTGRDSTVGLSKICERDN